MWSERRRPSLLKLRWPLRNQDASTVKNFGSTSSTCLRSMLSPLAKVTTVASVAEDYGGNSLDTPEEQHIYHVNHCFNIGNRDGYRDRKKKKVRSPEKSCTDVEGKQALDAGTSKAYSGSAPIAATIACPTGHAPAWSLITSTSKRLGD